jgi:hypothetical protein
MRKLFASLLVLPFLAGANRPTAPGDHRPAAGEIVSIAAHPAPNHAWPGHIAAPGFVTPSALLEVGSGGSWRTPTRTQRTRSDPPPTAARARDPRTHIDSLQRGRLEFGRTLARAHTSEPATFSNPPPVSQT